MTTSDSTLEKLAIPLGQEIGGGPGDLGSLVGGRLDRQPLHALGSRRSRLWPPGAHHRGDDERHHPPDAEDLPLSIDDAPSCAFVIAL
jgi:hypothetical protein